MPKCDGEVSVLRGCLDDRYAADCEMFQCTARECMDLVDVRGMVIRQVV